MKQLLDPGLQILACHSILLGGWGRAGESYKAPYWRLYRNDRHGLEVRFGGKIVRLAGGAIYMIPPDTDFSPVFRGPVRHFYMHFTALAPYDIARPGIYRIPDADTLARTIDAAEPVLECEDQAVAAKTNLMVLSTVLAALARLPGDIFTFRAADERIERVLLAMQARMRNPYSNFELAELAHMTPNAFIQRFHATVGESPQQYYARKRIDKACVLLHFSGKSIDQIAEETGFCDRFHLSKVFRKLRGMGPSTFRRLA